MRQNSIANLRAEDIRRAVHERGIGEVIHFTQIRNLPTIIEHGLLPRAVLHERDDIEAQVIDAVRMDAQDHAVSVSITAFNPEMFSAKRWKSDGEPWIVLALCPSVLWTHACRFHHRNAVSGEMLRRYGRRDHIWAFQEMFAESGPGNPAGFKGNLYREETAIPSNFTTFPDAEVQVLGAITPDLIQDAWIDREDLLEPVKACLDQLPGDRSLSVGEFNPRFTNGYANWG